MTEAVDTMFAEAVEALREGDRPRARDLLTRLIKANQKDVTYWIWMSAAVDTLTERVYCLETALKLDPVNETARRGLILMGARPPDKNVKPFSLNRARVWEDKLFLAHELPRQTGLQAFTSNPATRLAATMLTGALLIGAVLLIGINRRAAVFHADGFLFAGPSPTFSPTPTFVNADELQAGTAGVPTPLAVLLGISYTPTPAYVNTPRSPITADIYRAAHAAQARGDWDSYVREMLQVQQMEPEAADIQYQIAELYRLNGECGRALYYYNESLKVDRGFAPGYLGLARARLCSDPGANVLPLIELAQESDPAYGEVYLERAQFHLGHKDFDDALPDLEQAARLMPESALVQLGFAQAYLMQGNTARALAAAQAANSIDRTLLPAYYYLGRAYIENDEYDQAVQPLEIFLIYESRDGPAFALLGQALAETGDYRSAVEALNQALRLDRNQVGSFVYLGTSYLRLGNRAGAEVNFKRAIEYFPDSFDANIGLTEIYYMKGTYGTAYLQAETAFSKAEDDTERARAIYWRALAHEGRQSWNEAIRDWRALLNMSASAMTAEMRLEAQEHLRDIATPTRTPRGIQLTNTPTPSLTKRPGSTVTPPTGVKSPTPPPAP
ncbi:MAG: tetratricopeptide repeat protein [Chloroflexota bacterium]